MSDQPTTPDEDETEGTDAPQGDQQEQTTGSEEPTSDTLEAGPGPGHSDSAGDDYRDSQIGGDEDALHDAFEALDDEPSVDDVDPDEAARNAEDQDTSDPDEASAETGDAG